MSDIERRLLARTINPDAIALAWDEGVRPEWFEEPLYQAVFVFTVDYWRQAQMKAAPTPWALSQEFPGYTVTDDAEETTDYLVSLLQRRFTTNRLQEMVKKAAVDSVKDPVGALKELHGAAYGASETVAPRNLRINMAETITERRERYGKREECPQGLGVTYGIDLLDLYTGGLLPGELAVLGAFSKTGKTMFLLNAAADAVRKGYRPIVFSLELSLEDTQERLDAMFSGVSYNRLTRGHLSIDEMKKLWEKQEELAALGGLAVERPPLGERTVIALCARARQLGCDYVILDQLSYLEPGQRTQSLKEHHSVIMSQLKNEISRAGVELPCLLAVQANRDSFNEGMTLKSFANATEIEQIVDIALGLWRNQDMRANHCMRMEILGSRRSDITSWLLAWELTESTGIRALEEIRG